MGYDWSKYDAHPGWQSLIKPLIQRCQDEGVLITQIKEKFGALRFYTGAASDDLHKAINEACHKSRSMCESCGAPAETSESDGWLVTLCEEHLKKYRS